MQTQRTEQLLDDLDDHIDAAVGTRDAVLHAIADRTITTAEADDILTWFTRLEETAEPLPLHAEHLHAAAEVIGIVNRAGVSDKAVRRVRELNAGIVRLDEVRAARMAKYVEGPSAA